ncbi:hypothetical protein DFH06DRAFT_1350996 [Mycena polygramma]|nr:hypothetical protein DFH06DRAFT_1350996 [Mycena polygramma]
MIHQKIKSFLSLFDLSLIQNVHLGHYHFCGLQMDELGLCHRCGVVVAGDTDTAATSATELTPEAQPWLSADPKTQQPILLNSNEPPLDSDVPVTFHSIVDLAIITDTPAATANTGVLLDILDEKPLGSRVVAPQQSSGSAAMPLVLWMHGKGFLGPRAIPAALLLNSGDGPDAAVLTLREEGLDFVFVDGSDASVAMDGWRCYTTYN